MEPPVFTPRPAATQPKFVAMVEHKGALWVLSEDRLYRLVGGNLTPIPRNEEPACSPHDRSSDG